jgi:hypothetical protein
MVISRRYRPEYSNEQGIEVLTPEDLYKIVAVADGLVNWVEKFLQHRFPTA